MTIMIGKTNYAFAVATVAERINTRNPLLLLLFMLSLILMIAMNRWTHTLGKLRDSIAWTHTLGKLCESIAVVVVVVVVVAVVVVVVVVVELLL